MFTGGVSSHLIPLIQIMKMVVIFVVLLLLLGYKAVFHWLLGLPYAVLWPSISLSRGCPRVNTIKHKSLRSFTSVEYQNTTHLVISYSGE